MIGTLPASVVLGEVVPLLGLVDAWLLTRLTPKLVAPWASSDSASFRRFLLAMREREFGLTADEAAARALSLGGALCGLAAVKDARGVLTWRGPRHETALHAAARAAIVDDELEAHLRALIVLGANPNATDARSNTALHALIEENHPFCTRRLDGRGDALRMLATAGADVNAARASDGWTPLHLAAAMAFPETDGLPRFGKGNARGLAAQSRALIASLLDLGADPERRNRFGETPADCAGGLAGEAVREAIHELAPGARSRAVC